ncbi:two-component system, chemotaxis family, sensor kinase CheA [Devosia sp. YR412]|uniref:chemotaxis protein CheA n=1 Tax=Devosia sp. YR412 TaxID=1881030 RepID=UPI0008C63153|nr:chemotaxis protein CheA [Devosia sp. YR412]SEQ09675.1 two-component system, chemotaxis family, sensor kinase CheA [Devosia sp. YR412]
MDELMEQFIVEARELVQAAIDDLFALETDPADAARLDSAFRAVHTLKGSTGLFDLPSLNATLHKAEDNLGRVRAGTASLDTVQIDAIVAVLEWIDQCVDDLEKQGEVSPQRLAQASTLAAALGGESEADTEGAVPAVSGSIAWALALAEKIGGAATVALRYLPHAECFFSGDDPVALLSRIPELTHLAIAPRDPWPAAAMFDPFRSNLAFEALSTAPLGEVEAVFRLVPDQVEIVPLGAPIVVPVDDVVADETRTEAMRELRVDPARIDALLDLVGELMTSKNGMAGLAAMAGALPGGTEIARRIAAVQKDLDRLTGALHGGVLQTRMVPVGQAFRRLPRLVRDLSRRLGKPTELLIEGDAIEADKTIVDELFEPLLHLVRNAMDHGIESAAERFAAGKPASATITLRVVAEGDHILVSLSDDGRGIDPGRIRTAAVGKGLVSAERAAALSDRDVLDLLFAAGFSTAAAVSDLSGRGVGLDAVRADATRLGGTVAIDSRLGHVTSTTLRLPVGFAMTQLLIVSVGTERYGVPMQAVLETVRVAQQAVTPIRTNRAFVLRDSTVPLLSLSDLLGLPAAPSPDETTVLVMSLANQRVGVVVDAIAERMETITRPLGGLLSGMPGMAGTTVLGNGQVLLVLDMAELIG